MDIPDRVPIKEAAGAFHLAFSASEVFAGVAVSDWPLPYAVLIYRFPSFVIFVVQPVFQVITAELPSSFQVPVIPSPRVAFAAPPLDSVISNECPAVNLQQALWPKRSPQSCCGSSVGNRHLWVAMGLLQIVALVESEPA
jgi:hypothetical protein